MLVVDDDRNMRLTLALIMGDEGYQVLTADNGTQALGILRRRPVDVILLDAKMPDMNGDEACARAKQLRPGTTVIMITAHVADDTARNALAKGASHILYKPLDIDRLLGLVRQAGVRQLLPVTAARDAASGT